MLQRVDLDSFAHIFSFIPPNHRGKTAHLLKGVSKHFFHMFGNRILDDQTSHDDACQRTDYFREVFGCMFIPTIYVQLFYCTNASGDEYLKDRIAMNEMMKRLFPNQFESISTNEFEIEIALPLSENSILATIVADHGGERKDVDESDKLLMDKEKNQDNLIAQIVNWRNDSKHSLTLNNFRELGDKSSINAFRFFNKFKLHIQYTNNNSMSEQEECTSTFFNPIMVWRENITGKSNRFTVEDDLESQCCGIIRTCFLNFIEYAEKYGEFKLNQIYTKKEIDELKKISREGSSTDLVDYLTIERNIMLHVTRGILSNNTNLIRQTSIASRYFKPKIQSALVIIENLSLVPWEAFSNEIRKKFSAVIMYYLFEDKLNISDEYLSKYRNDHQIDNHQIDNQSQSISYGSTSHKFVLTFQTLEMYRTMAVIRNNIVEIPFYPSKALEGFSHKIPLNQISTFSTSLDSVNLCCMKNCTFNTITAPLWCIPCCCWWGSMTCCCLYPFCYETDKCSSLDPSEMCNALIDSKHRFMSCFDCDVFMFVSAASLCYPCCLLKARVTDGPYLPAAKSWTIREDKIFGNSDACNIL